MDVKLLTIEAPAKINLSLDILSRRPDGYHDLETVMQAIPLCDYIHLTEQLETAVYCNHPDVPNGETNLAYRAAQLLRHRFGINRGVKIEIDKRIPVAAGLAGGSTDAAAVLKGLNRLWSLGLSTDEMMNLAEQLGSDVPFCLLGGTALGRGRGEQLSVLPPLPNCYLVVAKPHISVSTAWAYRQVDPNLLPYPNCSAAVIEGLNNGDLHHVARNMDNALECVTAASHPVVTQLKAIMLDNGALGALMSGSGPTVFCITSDGSSAREIAAKIQRLTNEVFVVH